jgi:predicted flap endonuclease-1-like 5' DNA nuclease
LIPGTSPDNINDTDFRFAGRVSSSDGSGECAMSYPIEDIEGIGPAYAQKLAEAGITKTGDLLEKCATPKGRKDVAGQTGISESVVLKWTNMADLMRISGVAEEYSELLEAAGVDTVKELKHRNPDNLAAKMAETNEQKKLTRQVPSVKQVTKWVEQAKDLEPILSY